MTTRIQRELKKAAQQRFPGRVMQWIGGILYFRDVATWPPPEVPDVPKSPKTGQEAEGYKAMGKSLPMVRVQPKPTREEPQWGGHRTPHRDFSSW